MIKQKKTGLILILIGFGIPIISLCFQTEDLLFEIKTPTYKEIERKLTQDEINAIKAQSIQSNSPIIKTTEELFGTKEQELKALSKERRAQSFEQWADEQLIKQIDKLLYEKNYYTQKWIVKSKALLTIRWRYFLGIGFIFIFTGIGKIILSPPTRRRSKTNKIIKKTEKSKEEKI